MNNFVVFNSACSKCNITLNYIKERNLDFEVINYLDGELTREEAQFIFENIADKTKLLREEITPDNFSDFYAIIKSSPELLQRPIIHFNGSVFVNRPADVMQSYF